MQRDIIEIAREDGFKKPKSPSSAVEGRPATVHVCGRRAHGKRQGGGNPLGGGVLDLVPFVQDHVVPDVLLRLPSLNPAAGRPDHWGELLRVRGHHPVGGDEHRPLLEAAPLGRECDRALPCLGGHVARHHNHLNIEIFVGQYRGHLWVFVGEDGVEKEEPRWPFRDGMGWDVAENLQQ